MDNHVSMLLLDCYSLQVERSKALVRRSDDLMEQSGELVQRSRDYVAQTKALLNRVELPSPRLSIFR